MQNATTSVHFSSLTAPCSGAYSSLDACAGSRQGFWVRNPHTESELHQGLLEEQHFPAASFDVVTLFEVIEHLPAPMALLHECHRILRPNGILVASTGNTASWTVAAMQARWDYFQIAQDAGHVSFFNPRSIALVAARTGFGVAHIGTTRVRFFEESAAPRWLYRLGKIAAEFANLPARLLGTGHDMLVFLRRHASPRHNK